MDVQSPAPRLAGFLKSVNLQSILTKKVYTLGYYRALLRLWGRKGKKKKNLIPNQAPGAPFIGAQRPILVPHTSYDTIDHHPA